jgi:cytochrome c553
MFGFLKKRVAADPLAKSLARYAIGRDACAMMAGMMSDRTVEDDIAIAEFAFLRASYLRSLIAEYCKGATLQRMHEIVDREVVDAYSGREIAASREIAAYYQNQKMAEVAKARLASYRELGDDIDRTTPVFCTRMGARNVMSGAEIKAMLNHMLGTALHKSLKSVRPV